MTISLARDLCTFILLPVSPYSLHQKSSPSVDFRSVAVTKVLFANLRNIELFPTPYSPQRITFKLGIEVLAILEPNLELVNLILGDDIKWLGGRANYPNKCKYFVTTHKDIKLRLDVAKKLARKRMLWNFAAVAMWRNSGKAQNIIWSPI